MAARHKWTPSEIEWLKQNIHKHSWNAIHTAFNQHFKTNELSTPNRTEII